ncbi:MAG: FxsA family protein [Acidimicrobiia bacterium]
MVTAILIVAFVVIPLLELWCILAIGAQIGILPTLALLLAISIGGGFLVHRIGIGVWRRARATLATGQVPTRELLDGAIVFGAGTLLLVPGFLTDIIGLLIVTPPVRSLIRRTVQRRTASSASATHHVESEWTVIERSDIVEGITTEDELRRIPPGERSK